MELTTIAETLGNLHLENSHMTDSVFYGIFKKMLKGYPPKKKAFIIFGEIVRSASVKAGQSVQLSFKLEDDYTHKIILQQNYIGKVEIVLARFLKPPRDSEDTNPRVKLFLDRQPYHAMA